MIFLNGRMRKWEACLQASYERPKPEKERTLGHFDKRGRVSHPIMHPSHPPTSPHHQRPCIQALSAV